MNFYYKINYISNYQQEEVEYYNVKDLTDIIIIVKKKKKMGAII